MGLKKEDDGIFFMDFNDFRKYFSDMQVCYYHDDYKFSFESVKETPDSDHYFKIKIPKEGVFYLTLSQESNRSQPAYVNYKYSTLSLVLARILDGETFEYIQGIQRNEREVFLRFQCSKAGEYLVYVGTNWQSSVRNFSLSIYGPDKADIVQVSENAFASGYSLNAIYKDRARKWSKAYTTFEEYGEPDIKYFFD